MTASVGWHLWHQVRRYFPLDRRGSRQDGRRTINAMLYGRGGEQAAIERLLRSARAGAGGALVLRGEPGIGKSALLGFAAAAAGHFSVLRAAGVEAESGLAYATLHQLLHPVLDGVGRLPAAQADALRAAFGLREADVPGRFLVAVAVLAFLSEVAGDRPVLCVVDDAQLVDGPSMEALAFVARRLEADPVALLVAVREGEGREVDTTGMPELRLSGLDPPSSATLLRERCGADLAPAVGDTLARSTGGNPLALIEAADSLTERQLAGRDPLPESVPLAGALEALYVERIRRRSPEAQVILLLVAAEGSGYLGVVGRAASQLGVDPMLLGSAELDDLLVVNGPAVAFRHPLVRSAAYQAASPSARRAAHLALAEALRAELAEADRRAWHLAQASAEPDEDVAAALEHSAKRALRRSGYAAAAAALERAAELSPSEDARARRLLGAADAFWLAGDAGRARAGLDALERLRPAEAAQLGPRALRGSIELHTGVPGDALAILLQAGREAAGLGPRRALRILGAAREAAYHAMETPAIADIGQLVLRLPRAGDSDDALLIRLLASMDRVMNGEDAALRAEDLSRADALDDPELQLWAGGVTWGLGDYALGRRLRAKAVTRFRTLGAIGPLASALDVVVADEILRGHYQLAEAYAEEGRRLALEAGRPNAGCLHLASLTQLAALRGREQATRRLAAEVLTEATSRGLVKAADTAHLALGSLALVAGRAEDALAEYGLLRGSGTLPVQYGVALHCIPDQVEAAVRAGRVEECRERIAAYLAWADAVGSAELRALAARSRALLSAGDEAEAAFQEALRLHAVSDRPLEQARTQLLYGERLRREQRRVQARVQLRAALEAFERLGVPLWAVRAVTELRATGESARRRDPAALDQLTPQELQVARLVGQGATNHEAAAQLFLSPRTIDYHLRKVFRKAGISSRAELIRLVYAGDPLLKPPGDAESPSASS